MTTLAAVQEVARGWFRPEYQHFAEMLDESIMRNPEGWETWFAIKGDEYESADRPSPLTAPTEPGGAA